jgi:dipeptidyl aminopeptidase/acylaminoacyl peptidase
MHHVSGLRSAPLSLLALVALATTPLLLSAQSGYREPPPAIAAILDASPTPTVSLSPDRRRMALLERSGYPSIAEVAAPELRLAGLRFDPVSNGPSRGSGYRGIALQTVTAGAEPTALAIPLPGDGRGAPIGNVSWSPAGDRIFFTITSDDRIEPWLADVATGAVRKLADVRLNAVLGSPCQWLGAEPALICRTVPADRGPAPAQPTTPDGPIMQETKGGSNDRVATYQDLLASPHDEALFAFYATSQVVRLGVDGAVTPIGARGIHGNVSPSPDGAYLLVTTHSPPFSYVVPLSFFPTTIGVWDLTGREVKRVHTLPLRERVPWGGDVVDEGPRAVRWRSDTDATLVWHEATRGDTVAVNGVRDRVQLLAAPFTGAPVTMASLGWRAGGVTWARADLAIVTERWNRTREVRTWLVNPSRPEAAPRQLWTRSSEDRYNDPGSFLTTADVRGQSRLLTTPDGRHAFLSGAGASDEGDRPFLDRYDLTTGRTDRVFQSARGVYETPLGVLDARGDRLLTRRESKTEPPNYWLRNVRARIAPIALTTFADPAPQFAGVTSELITYTRKDGVQLSATLYLPAGYDKERDGPLPFLLWAYPQEFRSAAAAAQVQGSPDRFVRPSGSSHLFALLEGYGVLDGPTMPIIGEGDAEPNDTYVQQLVTSAEAAVDAIVARGVADRERIGVGGHSYGAFMTANLLAHSRLFKAGVARSGAYNRTLTPFGFQAEQRTYWEAQEIYTTMSPFTHANTIKDPILLIHGMADNNTGTFPIQSERMYAALKGNGATVRYVQLPAESHGYAARESIGHVLAETMAWLDAHVKPKGRTAMD